MSVMSVICVMYVMYVMYIISTTCLHMFLCRDVCNYMDMCYFRDFLKNYLFFIHQSSSILLLIFLICIICPPHSHPSSLSHSPHPSSLSHPPHPSPSPLLITPPSPLIPLSSLCVLCDYVAWAYDLLLLLITPPRQSLQGNPFPVIVLLPLLPRDPKCPSAHSPPPRQGR